MCYQQQVGAERQPVQTAPPPGGEPEPGWEQVGAPPPGGDLDDHGSALRTATSAVWNGTGECSGDPMTESRASGVPLGPKLQPGKIL